MNTNDDKEPVVVNPLLRESFLTKQEQMELGKQKPNKDETNNLMQTLGFDEESQSPLRNNGRG